jgi:two-component system chemotaxis response regulator CheB
MTAVVIAGASAGGVPALGTLLRGLPADLPAAVLVVLHLAPDRPSALPDVLGRESPLPVRWAGHGEPLLPGTVACAPPDTHLVVHRGRTLLLRTPRENGHRPAVDLAMRSAAGPNAVGVVLSGAQDDGASGLRAIVDAGGHAVVQDPGEASYPDMVQSALSVVADAVTLPAAEIGAWLAGRVRPGTPAPLLPVPDDPAVADPRGLVPRDGTPLEHPDGVGTRFICPDCGGALFEHDEGGQRRFACSVGHAYSIESLAHGQGVHLESALWAAVRALEDRIVLLSRLARKTADAGSARSAEHFRRQAEDLQARSAVIRDAVEQLRPPVTE